MTSKEAVKLAYTEFQKDFDGGEETNQWLTNVIKGLKQAEKDLEVLETLKYCITDKCFICDTDSDSIHLKIKAEKLKPYYDKDGNQLFPVNIYSDYDLLKEWLNER